MSSELIKPSPDAYHILYSKYINSDARSTRQSFPPSVRQPWMAQRISALSPHSRSYITHTLVSCRLSVCCARCAYSPPHSKCIRSACRNGANATSRRARVRSRCLLSALSCVGHAALALVPPSCISAARANHNAAEPFRLACKRMRAPCPVLCAAVRAIP